MVPVLIISVNALSTIVMEEILMPIMYTVPSDDTVVRVVITSACVSDGAEPLMERDPQKPVRLAEKRSLQAKAKLRKKSSVS